MAAIQLATTINAPIERCFLLSLSVDLHVESAKRTKERAIAGVTSGPMKLNETVTWEARHFGLRQRMTTRIIAYSFPNYFISTMVSGPFKKIRHQHIFHAAPSGTTTMTDLFEYEAPLGIFGRIAEKLFLTRHLKKFLALRNEAIKRVAEGEDWKKYIHGSPDPKSNERAAWPFT
jgi:ligand-binding SRPBCC domain-containing protein